MKKKITFAVTILFCVLSTGMASAVIDPGLELHWNFDEGSGTVANDDSGHGNNGTLYNGATYVPGHDNLAVALNGVDQYAQVDTPLNSLGTVDQPYALSAWVKVPAGVTQGNIIHISSNADGSGWCIPFLRLEGGVFRATGWDTTNGEESAIGTTSPVAGRWYQVLTSWDATNGLRLFVDGNLEASTPQADYAAAGAPIYVSAGLSNGSCSKDQGFLNGQVDDVRIYSRALTSTDIQTISTEGIPVVQTASATPSPSPGVPTLTNTGTNIFVTSAFAVLLITAGIAVTRVRAKTSSK